MAYVPCPAAYDSVHHYHSMSYYVLKENGKVRVEVTLNYRDAPKPKHAKVKENAGFGISLGYTVNDSYKNNPDAFDFLRNPDPYISDIMSMQDIKKNFGEVL